ncbi:hypothetical protein BCV70DRAFT_213502 [Testicularia cyperi]|uniref:Uncharacterized protein n=1 Tax=Testicularia cyperi TaxID=1882483 RepID=A0A317XHD6_9BASI|nr:hypothetical protein BCV70DRAFT_213502 [Testicularia cyperi]
MVVPSHPTNHSSAAATTISRPTIASQQRSTGVPSRMQVRLPPSSDDVTPRRHPLKRKWKTFVNFFALPIREYYQAPPGTAYRNRMAAQWADSDDGLDNLRFWPCPAYTGEVGDDEMILFKAQEEAQAEALAEAQRRQHQTATESQHTTEEEDPSQGVLHDNEALALEADLHDVLETIESQTSSSAQHAVDQQADETELPTDTLTGSSSPTPAPYFANGAAMARHSSTPLASSTSQGSLVSLSASPHRPSVLSRRSRAVSNAAATVGGRTISEPLTWTLVRSQYSYPKRGPTPQQLSFLSSVESLGRFGVPHTPDASNLNANPNDTPNLGIGTASPALGTESPAYQENAHDGPDYGFPVVLRESTSQS